VGVAETKLGHKDQARRAFQKAIDLSGGGYAWAEFGFGYLSLSGGEIRGGSNHYPERVRSGRQFTRWLFILGMALLRLERWRRQKEARMRLFSASLISPRPILCCGCLRGADMSIAAQMQDLDVYLKLEPNGEETNTSAQARASSFENF